MTLEERAVIYGPIIRRAFEAEGLPGAWGMAIACQESGFQPRAEVSTGGDARRGGSFGICQMSLATAQGDLGYLGGGEGLKDPLVNAQLAARYVKILIQRHKTNDLRDIAAAYNSGRPYATAPKSTRGQYVPRVLAYAQRYGETPVKP